MQTPNLIDSSAFYSFSISVTEEIQAPYLLTFLRTHIRNQKYIFNQNTYVYYHFHKYSLQYDILVFDKHMKNSIPEVLVLQNYPSMKTSIVFILDNFFCFYYERELVFFKNIDTIEEKDIYEYILQVYNTEVEEFIYLKKDQITALSIELSKEDIATIQKRTFPFKESKSFIYFQYFILVSTLVFFLLCYIFYTDKIEASKYLHSLQSTKQAQLQKQLITKYQHFNKQAPIKKIKPLLVFLNDLKIKVIKLEYAKQRFSIKLSHQKKALLLSVLKNKNFSFKTQAIYFDKNLKSHILE